MKVSRITSDNDWTFGRGLANYISKADAVHQKVRTRLQEFKNDWILDTEKGIDWIDLLGRKGTQNAIEREIERVCIGTIGVATVDDISVVVDRTLRTASISVTITDVYSDKFNTSLEIIA